MGRFSVAGRLYPHKDAMSVSLNVNLSGLTKSPFVAGSKYSSIRKLVNELMKMATGRFEGKVTFAVKDAAAAASATATFAGVLTAADTVTINGVAVTAQQSYARGVVTAASAQDGDTVTVGGVTFTARTSPSTALEFALGVSDTACAANLVAKVNANATTLALVKAYSAAAVVTVRNLVIGTAGNNGGASQVALASSNNTRFAVTGTASGHLNGASAAGNNLFDIGNTTLEALTNFVAAVNTSSTALVSGVGGVVATSDGATVATLTAVVPGSTGNAVTLAKSASNVTVSAARLAGGSETAFAFKF